MVDGIRVKINRAGPRPDYQGDERQVRQYLALWHRPLLSCGMPCLGWLFKETLALSVSLCQQPFCMC